MMGHDVAQVCPSGHVVNARATKEPEENTPFCSRCGQETITKCLACQTPIRGERFEEEEIGHTIEFPGGETCPLVETTWFGLGRQEPPKFCLHCGAAFPWTDRKTRALREFIDELAELTDEEKEKLRASVDDIVSERPGTELATVRFRKAIGKIGKQGASALCRLLERVAVEGAVRLLWPDGRPG